MDSEEEGEQARKEQRWQGSSVMQTPALSSQDLPDNPVADKEFQFLLV